MQTPKKTLTLRNLLAKVPALSALIEKADLRTASLPDGLKADDIPGRDYYFPASLKGKLESLQKELDSAVKDFHTRAEAIAIETLADANGKLLEKFQVEEAFPLPSFRGVESPSLYSHVKSSLHDGWIDVWYDSNPDAARPVKESKGTATAGESLGLTF